MSRDKLSQIPILMLVTYLFIDLIRDEGWWAIPWIVGSFVGALLLFELLHRWIEWRYHD